MKYFWTLLVLSFFSAISFAQPSKKLNPEEINLGMTGDSLKTYIDGNNQFFAVDEHPTAHVILRIAPSYFKGIEGLLVVMLNAEDKVVNVSWLHGTLTVMKKMEPKLKTNSITRSWKNDISIQKYNMLCDSLSTEYGAGTTKKKGKALSATWYGNKSWVSLDRDADGQVMYMHGLSEDN
jgi:hypothetical protein